MRRDNPSMARRLWGCLLIAILSGVLGIECSRLLRATPFLQSEEDVSPEATPEVQQVKPNQAAAGEELTVEIEGRNFSRGVYVSFSSPAVHVLSTERISATRLKTQIAVARKAQAGGTSLYVSNPAGSVTEVPFTIAGGQAAPIPPPASPATTVPGAQTHPSQTGAPEVTAVDPQRAAQGSQINLKVTGKNFGQGAKVSFSNPGIRVLETVASSATELVAKIQVARDAPTGATSLFVVNPDDSEVEIKFEVAEPGPNPPAAQTGTTTAAKNAGSAAQRFEVFNLGEGISILQNLDKPKGILTLAGGKLIYEEAGKELLNVGPADIKEIEVNSILGVNTGTFHVILNSGKTFNFVAASLRPAETQAIVDSLRRALH